MKTLQPFDPGGYRFLEGGFPYSQGAIAMPGFAIVRARFARPLPMRAGFDAIEAHLRAAGRPLTALCAADCDHLSRSRWQGFQDFNRDYVDVLEGWGLVPAGLNPVARSNVCPLHRWTGRAGFHAFCYTVTGAGAHQCAPATFVVAGSGEWPEHVPFPPASWPAATCQPPAWQPRSPTCCRRCAPLRGLGGRLGRPDRRPRLYRARHPSAPGPPLRRRAGSLPSG